MAEKNSNKKHPVHNLFEYNSSTNTSLCQKGCILTGKHSSNLWRHVKRKHDSIAKTLSPEVKKFQEEKAKNRKLNSKNVFVEFRKEDIIKACVELTNINGRPRKLMEDSGFRKILDPICEAFSRTVDTLDISRHNIAEFSDIEKNKIIEKIKNETKNKMVTVQIDSSTVLER